MRLSSHDASFLYTETASGPMHGVGLAILGGPATYQEIFDYYAARVHLVPRLRQKLAFVPFNLAHPKWIDDEDFDLANHIKAYKVPPNTDLSRAQDIALELGEELLDRSKPLWLNYVMENVEGKTLLVQMSHHAFVDGATAVAMSLVLTDPEPNPEPPEPAPPWQPAKAPTPFELWQEAVTESAQSGVEQAREIAQNAERMRAVTEKGGSLMQRMSLPVMQAPWNSSLVGPKRHFALLRHTVDEIKSTAKALGGTINDLAVAAVVEGAAVYLKQKGEVVDGQYLRLMCPVDVRGEDDDPLGGGGNRVSAMFPRLGAWPMGAVERFEAVREELSEIKQNGEPEVLDQLQEMQPNVPPVAQAQTLSVGTQWDPTVAAARAPLPVLPVPSGAPRPQQLGFNFTCSNIAGPNWQQYIAGYPVETSVGTLMLGGNLGMGVGVGSYNGQFTFGFTADPRLMPDLDAYAALVEASLSELMGAAQMAGSKAGAAKTATRKRSGK